jgi:hypothetical protein
MLAGWFSWKVKKGMVRILLRFSEELVEQPITSKIILEQKIPVNIITAHVNSKGGEILAEIPDESLDKTVKAFREKGYEVLIMTDDIDDIILSSLRESSLFSRRATDMFPFPG